MKVVFEGGLRPIKLLSDEGTQGDPTGRTQMFAVTLRDSVTSTDSSGLLSPNSALASMTGVTDLTFQPSQTKAFNLTAIPREAGEAKIASITLMIDEEKFDLAYSITGQTQPESFWWHDTGKGPVRKRIGKDRDTHVCKILPKPPKIRLAIPNLKETYYTNERVALDVSVENEEDETADLSIEARLFGHQESIMKLAWADEEMPTEVPEDSGDSSPMGRARHSLRRSIGTMESSSTRNLSVILSDTSDAFDYELELSVLYHLVSDPETPISKTLTVDLSFIRPFEANYEFLPRLHPQPWPNFFLVDEGSGGDSASSSPKGLQQKWCLNSKLVSFAPEPLVVEKVALVLLGISGGANCEISSENLLSPGAPVIMLEELRESEFVLNIQKLSLEDRRSISLNLALEIQWRRADLEEDSESSTTTLSATTPLAIPRFLVPIGEPRILASAISSSTIPGFIHLDYTLENPSLHFLTFSLTMEVSDQFAFSGPKTTTVQLVPLSRHTIRYNLLASKRGEWIQPQLVVVDTYFNKTLRVLATEGMRSDKRGLLIWVDADE